jgi:hypothetical protein
MQHPHPLAVMITDVAEGRFLAPDGGWHRVPPWRDGLEGVVSFTARSVLAVGPDVPDSRLAELGADGLGGADHPRLITALAGPGGWIDCLDMLLAARGTGGADVARGVDATGGAGGGGRAGGGRAGGGRAGGGGVGADGAKAGAGGEAGFGLVDRADLAGQPRAQFAARIRDRRRVLGYADRQRSALVVLSTGLAGLTELSFELEPGRRGGGQAADLIRAALACVPRGELVVAAAAPGNVASVRALLTAGFTPVGSVQLWRPAR